MVAVVTASRAHLLRHGARRRHHLLVTSAVPVVSLGSTFAMPKSRQFDHAVARHRRDVAGLEVAVHHQPLVGQLHCWRTPPSGSAAEAVA